MTMAEVKAKEWGNSIGVIIPNDIVKHERIKKGDIIKLELTRKTGKSGFGMFKKMAPFKREHDHRDDDF